MKTKTFLFVLLAIQVAGLFSCTKDVSTKKLLPVEQRLKFINAYDRIDGFIRKNAREGIVIVSWNEWGRKKKDCKGMGLCNAHWFPKDNTIVTNPDNGEGGSSLLEYDNANDQYYFDILLAANPPADLTDSDLEFVIDYEINLDTKSEIGVDLSIVPGTYQFESSRGDFGGYRILLKSH